MSTDAPALLVRKLAQLTALEDDAEDVLLAEFCLKDGSPDLAVSAYEAPAESLVRLRSETCAGSGLDKPAPATYLDVSNLHARIEATADNDWFQFANAAHRELLFADRDELLLFIERLQANIPVSYEVSRPRCKHYVSQILLAGDAEWRRFVEEHPKGPKWREFVGLRK